MDIKWMKTFIVAAKYENFRKASEELFPSSILPSILRGFIDQNPDIDVLINVLKSYEIGEEISAGRADLGLTRIKPIQTNIDCHIVHEEPVILVGPTIDEEIYKYDEKTILQKYRLITHNHPDYWDHLLNDIKCCYPKSEQ